MVFFDGVVVVVVGVVGAVVVPPPVSTTSCGWLALASRLGRLLLVLLVVSNANDTTPEPVTSEVTSNDTIVFAAIGAGDAITAAPVAGLFENVNPVSVHDESATGLTLIGVVVDTGTNTFNVALAGAPVRPCTSNFR